MAKIYGTLSLLFLLVICFPAQLCFSQTPKIGKRVDLGKLELEALKETSGIAASRKNQDVFWLHNDSGDRNVLYAINSQAKHLGTYQIVGAKPGDWEDIAVGPGPNADQHYIYIGNIGDNDANHKMQYIYRILEPKVSASQRPARIKLYGAKRITFVYPDGPRDAETLMVDPLTKDIFIISKREAKVHVYRAPFPQLISQPITLQQVATLPVSWVVAGDISPSGREILIKTYDAIYYWVRPRQKPLWQAFAREPVMLPYYLEPQGEAIAWQADGMGYYTVSEVFKRIPAHLYFYPRLSPGK